MSEMVWQRITQARNPKRPTAKYYIEQLFEDFLELAGDRFYGEDLAIVSGIGLFEGMPVTVIGQEKGPSLMLSVDIDSKRYFFPKYSPCDSGVSLSTGTGRR